MFRDAWNASSGTEDVRVGDRVLVAAPVRNGGTAWGTVTAVKGRDARKRVLRVTFRNTIQDEAAGEFAYGVAEVIDHHPVGSALPKQLV